MTTRVKTACVEAPRLLSEPRRQSAANKALVAELEPYWASSPGSVTAKLQNFPKNVRREDVTKFLMRNDAFRKQLSVHGSVVDLGVARGASLMTWLHLSSIYEPANYTRKIIGFDTFAGIPEVDEKDMVGSEVSDYVTEGGFAVESHMRDDIVRAVQLHDQTRTCRTFRRCIWSRGTSPRRCRPSWRSIHT